MTLDSQKPQAKSQAESLAAAKQIIDNDPDAVSKLEAIAESYVQKGVVPPNDFNQALEYARSKSADLSSNQTQIQDGIVTPIESETKDSSTDGIRDIKTDNKNERRSETTVRLGRKSTMKKLPDEEIAALRLENISEEGVQALYPAHDEKTGEDFFILHRPEAAFKLDESSPLIQEVQLEVASTMINATQTRSPIDRAAAIKAALKQHGFNFKGGPFELLKFAVEAMDIVIDFEKRQTQMRMMDIHQAGLLQLQEDMGANIAQFYLLPPHRRMNVALLSQVFMIRDAEEIMTDQTVQRSEDMKTMNLNLEQMKKETRSAWMESAQEALQRSVQTTTGAAKQIITDIGGGITEVSANALGKLQAFALGEESVDSGTVNALLDSMGVLGTKLRVGLKQSGVDAVDFFKSMFRKDETEKE